MVLGNRKLIVASTLMALPVALMMASFTNGTSPEEIRQAAYVPSQANSSVVHASAANFPGVATEASDEQKSSVRQVGLLENLAERRANPSTNSAPAVKPAPRVGSATAAKKFSPSDQPRVASPTVAKSSSNTSGGLLGTLFSPSKSPQPTPAAAKPAEVERPPADWNGIPFHEPRVVARSKSSVPIRDPSAKAVATRIIRGGSPTSIQAIPASARRETRIALPKPAPVTRVVRPAPKPPTVAVSTPVAKKTSDDPLSSSNSSRRSGRRDVAVFNSQIAEKATRSSSSQADTVAIRNELVPKVSRRELPTEESETKSEEAKPAAETVAAKPEAETPQATAPESVADKSSIAANVPVEAAKAISPRVEPESVAKTVKSTLSPPTAAPATEEPSYVEPTEPDTAPLPIAGVPSHPYAASTPSAAVSHRTGPPATAFQPREAISSSPTDPQFNSVSAPIGSGLLPQLPGPNASPAADAYIAAAPLSDIAPAPQLDYGHSDFQQNRGTVPSNSIRSNMDPYAQQGMTPSNVPFQNSTAAGSRDHSGRDHSGYASQTPKSDLREDTTRRLKPGETAVASELPGIRVVTNGPSEIMIRQTQQYEIRVENRGSIDAQGVMVRAMIPDWAEVRGHNATQGQISPQSKNSASQHAFSIGAGERLVWTIDNLPAGATERMFIRLRAERSGSHGVDVDWTLVPQKSVAKVHVHEPQLSLVIDGPPQVTYGQSQTYKVRVMNPGDGIAPNVVFTLSPNSATPQTQKIGDIPAGKEAQFEVELTAQDLGDLKIHGLASGDLELRAEATKTIRVAAAKLEAIMNGPEVKYQNTEAVYQLQVKNNGNAMTEQVVATLQLPGGAKYLGGIADSLQRGQVIKWKIDALAPNATRDYEFRCNMSSTGDQLFSFDCEGTAAAQSSVSIATRVESIADLVMTINDPVAPAPVSSEVAYEIVVQNRGSRDATDVRAIAQFSHGIEPKRLEGHSGEVLTGQVLFDPIPRIGAGESVKLRIVAEADRAGHHRFRSEIRSGATVLVAEEATHFMDPKSERVSRSSSEQQVLR